MMDHDVRRCMDRAGVAYFVDACHAPCAMHHCRMRDMHAFYNVTCLLSSRRVMGKNRRNSRNSTTSVRTDRTAADTRRIVKRAVGAASTESKSEGNSFGLGKNPRSRVRAACSPPSPCVSNPAYAPSHSHSIPANPVVSPHLHTTSQP
eukprot:359793-Chlamydomonas_euryale.AAC.5